MMVLWEHKTLTVKELGMHLYLDSGTLTPLLKKLESDGLVTRERNLSDERNVSIKLTEKGKKLKETATTIPQQIGKCLPLSQEDISELYTLLYKILGKEQSL